MKGGVWDYPHYFQYYLSDNIPGDIASEKALAGLLLFSAPQIVVDAVKTTTPEDYQDPSTRDIITECLNAITNGYTIDPVSIRARLDKDMPRPGGWGNPLMQAITAASFAIPAVAPHYAKIIKETASRRRRIAQACHILDEELNQQDNP
ncbi:MAG: hypothetical protein FWG15_02875 [Propionibacteriaceae bacterium]|nr:hypothetical protein [Propionibacteriaceae bacterium]